MLYEDILLKCLFILKSLPLRKKSNTLCRRTAVLSLDADYIIKLFLQLTKGFFVLFFKEYLID